ncbi:MAG: sterol desaturase family protein [Sphingopyxis sp.]
MNDPKIMATAALASVFIVLALLEIWQPMRIAARSRWPLNLALGLASMLLVRLASIAGPLSAALWAEGHGVGLLNQFTCPAWLAIPLAIIAMDFAIYWQHRAMHAVPWGWVLHRLHHADAGFDVTTGVRFNPLEALVSMLYKAAIAALLGASPLTVITFEAYLALFSLFEHANLRLPAKLDAVLRPIWVTPAVHAIHHSSHGQDHNHNYGFAIAVWDHLFRTYLSAATGPNIGLPHRGQSD